MIQIGGVYTTLSAKRRAYFCKSIAIEMGGVSRYFSESIGVRRQVDSPEKLTRTNLKGFLKRGFERQIYLFRGLAKRWFSKRVVLADVPPEREPERGYIRIFLQNENQNEGTFACSPRTKNRNEDTFAKTTQHAESAKLDHRLQPQRSLAIWLGRCESTGEHILAKANNSSLVKSRTVTRLSLEASMDLRVFKTISIPPPDLSSSALVKMAKERDQPTDQQGGDSKLRLEFPPQAYTQPPQQRPRGRPRNQPAAFQPAFFPPPGLAQPSQQAPAFHPQPRGPQQPAVQHPPSATALPQQAHQPQPSSAQASEQQPVRRRLTGKRTDPIGSKLFNILEKARSSQEIELAVSAEEDELRDSKEALKDVHLQAYYEDDLSLFSEEDIKKAMLTEGENLQGTYEAVSKASFTPQQLKKVIKTRWVVTPRPSQEGEASLKQDLLPKASSSRSWTQAWRLMLLHHHI